MHRWHPAVLWAYGVAPTPNPNPSPNSNPNPNPNPYPNQANHADLSTSYAGLTFAIANTVATVPGLVSYSP